MTAATMIQPAAGRRDVGTHDPSTIVRCGDEYWFFATGTGIATFRSHDLLTWRKGPPVFDRPPAWTAEVNAHFKQHFWAPDVVYIRERYLLYYSVSSFGSRNSAIGLASTPTLNPADPAFKWSDHGRVIQTTDADDHNAIDPAVLLDQDGKLWMAHGSFWSGIKMLQLDAFTGLRATGAMIKGVAHHEQIEAPALFHYGRWYYLVVNRGWCCRGVNSTYSLHVGRSKQPDGPFRDRSGTDLLDGGGELLLGSQGSFIGPGHAGVLACDGRMFMSMHYYDGTQNGRSKLAILELNFTDDGWPHLSGALN